MVKVYELMNKGIDPIQYCLDKIEELGAEETEEEPVAETPQTEDAGAGSGSAEGGGASLE